MPPDPRVHVGVGVVVELDGALLMIQRGGTGEIAGDGHGTWSVPGGWIDYGETPWEAAEREAREETGVSVTAFKDAGFVQCESATTDIQIVTLFIRCSYIDGEPTVTEPDKCPEVRWVPLAAIPTLPLFAPLDAWLAKRAFERDAHTL